MSNIDLDMFEEIELLKKECLELFDNIDDTVDLIEHNDDDGENKQVVYCGVLISAKMHLRTITIITMQTDDETITLRTDKHLRYFNRFEGKKIYLRCVKIMDIYHVIECDIKEIADALEKNCRAAKMPELEARKRLSHLEGKKYDFIYDAVVMHQYKGRVYFNPEELELVYVLLYDFIPEEIRDVIERDLNYIRLPFCSASDKRNLLRRVECLLSTPYWKTRITAKDDDGLADSINRKCLYAERTVDRLLCEYERFKFNNNIAPELILIVGGAGSGKKYLISTFAEEVNAKLRCINVAGLDDETIFVGTPMVYDNAKVGKLAELICSDADIIVLENVDLLKGLRHGESAIGRVTTGCYENEFLEVPIDRRAAGKWMICTARTLDDVPDSIASSAVIINMPEYSSVQMKELCRMYIEKLCKEHDILRKNITFSKDAIDEICDITPRSNVGELIDNIEMIINIYKRKGNGRVRITAVNLRDYLPVMKERDILRKTYVTERRKLEQKYKLIKKNIPERNRVIIEDSFHSYDKDVNKKEMLDILTRLINLEYCREENMDISRVEKIMDEMIHGMKAVKNRILDCVAMDNRNSGKVHRPILLVSDPGCGKTSFGYALANALGRAGVVIYANRGYKNICEELTSRNVSSSYAVVIIDEIDKANDFGPYYDMLDQREYIEDERTGGEIPKQNLYFVLTANCLDTIPDPIVDRCSVIKLPDYNDEDKKIITKDYLIPKNISRAKTNKNIQFDDSAIDYILNRYRRANGVRAIEQSVEIVINRVARENGSNGHVDRGRIADILGDEDKKYFGFTA